MVRRYLTLGILAFAGAVGGVGLRALATKSEVDPPEKLLTQSVGGSPHLRGGDSDGGNLTSQRPNLAEMEGAIGSKRRLLLVQFLHGATLDEIIALMAEPWLGEFEERKWAHPLIHLRAVEVDPAGWVEWIDNDSDKTLSSILRSGAIDAWAVIDPEAAFIASEGMEDDDREGAIWHLSKIDPERARELLESAMPDSDMFRSIERDRLKLLAETDRESALEQAMSEGAMKNVGALRMILADWAETDSEAAWDWLGEQEGLENSAMIARWLIEKISEKDPIAANEKLMSLGDSAKNLRLRGKLLQSRLKEDFDGALQSVLDEPDSGIRSYLLTNLANEFSARDPRGFLQMIHEQGIVDSMNNIDNYSLNSPGGGLSSSHGSQMEDSVRRALLELGKESPQEALAFSRSYGGDDELSNTLIRSWVAEDPEVAADWALRLTDQSEFGTEMQLGIMRAWAERSPEQAAMYIADPHPYTDGSPNTSEDSSEALAAWFQGDYEYLAGTVANEWVATDPEAALQWARESAPSALPGALEALARFQPARAAQDASELPAGDDRQRVIGRIAETWRGTDPRATSEWLGALPVADDVNTQTNRAVMSWTQASPQEASIWLGTLEEGSRRDHAVAGLVQGMLSEVEFDGEAAREWVETISDGELRRQTQSRISARTGEDSE